MFIQIERIAGLNRRASERSCSTIDCSAPADWYLVDRDMPDAHAVNLGRVACCAAHIAATYLRLRGAHVIAQSVPPARLRDTRGGVDRRRAARRTAAGISSDVSA